MKLIEIRNKFLYIGGGSEVSLIKIDSINSFSVYRETYLHETYEGECQKDRYIWEINGIKYNLGDLYSGERETMLELSEQLRELIVESEAECK